MSLVEMEARPHVSVVVPVYRTAWALPELVRRIDAAVTVTVTAGGDGAEEWRHEIVLVDDASPDDVHDVAGGLTSAREGGRGAIRLLELPENVGQHRAVLAGVEASRGDWVVVMDGDLQDPPEAIPALLARAREGFDAVFAARVGRYQSWHRMLTSRLFKRTLARLCGLPAGSGMFFVVSRRLAERLRSDDRRPFVVAMVGLAGRPVSSLPVERAARPAGRSAYSSWRRLRAGASALGFARRHRRASRPAPPPGSSPASAAALAGAAGLLTLAVALLAARGHCFNIGDEGFRYLLSRAWADGTDLFRTFRLHYVPGQYVYFGAFLRLFGPSLESLWAAEAIVTALGVAGMVWTMARVAPAGLAAIAGATLACVAARNHATFASALVFMVAIALARCLEGGPSERPSASGHRRPSGASVVAISVLAGLLAGWREDSAVLAFALAGIAVWMRRRPRDLALRVVPGAVAGFVPWIVIFAARGQAGGLLAHVGHRLLFLFERLAAPVRPGWHMPDEPFTSPRNLATAIFPLLAAVPLVVYIGVLAWQAGRARRARPVSWPAVGAALVGIAYLPQFLWERPDLAHLLAHLHILVAAVALATSALTADRLRWVRRAATAGLAIVALAGLVSLARSAVRASDGGLVAYPSEEGARIGARVSAPAPPWAGRLGADGGRLLVLEWGAGWYVLEGQRPPTRFLYTGKRALRSAADIAELAADVEDPGVRWLLMGRVPTPDAPEIAARARELYAPVERWRVWELRERRPPPDS